VGVTGCAAELESLLGSPRHGLCASKDWCFRYYRLQVVHNKIDHEELETQSLYLGVLNFHKYCSLLIHLRTLSL
jgi:hypothetical protein